MSAPSTPSGPDLRAVSRLQVAEASDPDILAVDDAFNYETASDDLGLGVLSGMPCQDIIDEARRLEKAGNHETH